MSTVGPAGVGQITSMDIQDMDLESAMMAVQSNRANLLENQLKSQIDSVQKKNDFISKMNEALGELNKVAALFGGSAKADAVLKGNTVYNKTDFKMEKEVNSTLKTAGLELFNKNPGRDLTDKEMTGSMSGNTTKGEIDGAIQQIKSAIDSASNSQQMDMLRLQSLSNKRNEAFETMTNFIKKMQDSRSSIVGNMR